MISNETGHQSSWSPPSGLDMDLDHPLLDLGMEFGWASSLEWARFSAVWDILSNSTKDSTRKSYLAKWKCFFSWTQLGDVLPKAMDIPLILDYILSLKTWGLSLSCLQVHLAMISTFHPPTEGHSIFGHPPTNQFWKFSWEPFHLLNRSYPSRTLILFSWY